MKEYTLSISGVRDTYLTFTDYDAFVAEVRARLSPRERATGALDLLTRFNMKLVECDNGFKYYEASNNYKNIKTTCYASVEDE